MARAHRLVTAALVCALCGLRAARATAQESIPVGVSKAEQAIVRPVDDNDARGGQPELQFSIEVASAYVFRGYNVFQAGHQGEQKWVDRPRFVWAPSGAAFSVGYASANQLTGDDLVGNVAAGLGAEQDLFTAYEFGRNSRFGVATEVEFIAYPAADSRVTGTATPLFVSVSAEPRYRHDVYLYAGYLRDLRHGPFSEDHVYLNPRVERGFNLGRRFALDLEIGVGMKIHGLDLGVARNNMWDVLATATLYCALNEVFYVGAKVGWAWTNLASRTDPDTGQLVNVGFGDEYVPFWGLSVGAEFAAGAAPKPRTRRHTAHAL